MAASDVLRLIQMLLRQAPEEAESFGITQTKPKFPQYAVLSKRKESFVTWPEYIPVSVEVLVEAGLVYTGVGDSVRCFYCGGGLRNWEREDSPWEEHAKWYPCCPHVQLVKGQAYVDRVMRGERPDLDGPIDQTVTDQTLREELINTAAAENCLKMGYSKENVQHAIDRYFKNTGA